MRCTSWWSGWCVDRNVRSFWRAIMAKDWAWLRRRSVGRGLRQLLGRRVRKWDTLDRFYKLAEQLRLRKGRPLDFVDYKIAHKFCRPPFLNLFEKLRLFCSDLLGWGERPMGVDGIRSIGAWHGAVGVGVGVGTGVATLGCCAGAAIKAGRGCIASGIACCTWCKHKPSWRKKDRKPACGSNRYRGERSRKRGDACTRFA